MPDRALRAASSSPTLRCSSCGTLTIGPPEACAVVSRSSCVGRRASVVVVDVVPAAGRLVELALEPVLVTVVVAGAVAELVARLVELALQDLVELLPAGVHLVEAAEEPPAGRGAAHRLHGFVRRAELSPDRVGGAVAVVGTHAQPGRVDVVTPIGHGRTIPAVRRCRMRNRDTQRREIRTPARIAATPASASGGTDSPSTRNPSASDAIGMR